MRIKIKKYSDEKVDIEGRFNSNSRALFIKHKSDNPFNIEIEARNSHNYISIRNTSMAFIPREGDYLNLRTFLGDFRMDGRTLIADVVDSFHPRSSKITRIQWRMNGVLIEVEAN